MKIHLYSWNLLRPFNETTALLFESKGCSFREYYNCFDRVLVCQSNTRKTIDRIAGGSETVGPNKAQTIFNGQD